MAVARIGVLGMGLAGCCLAWELRRRGVPLVFTDTVSVNAASPMAPGIINPLAGRKFKLNSDLASHYQQIFDFYQGIEIELRRTFWRSLRLVRILENEGQRRELDLRTEEADAGSWIGTVHPPGTHGEGIRDPLGSFETLNAGWLDVPKFCQLVRKHLAGAEVDPEELPTSADIVVDCRGWCCAESDLWASLPWKPARGELIEFRLEEELPRAIWNGGGWLQPLPEGGWRAGATYSWSGFEAPVSDSARCELIERLQRWLRIPFEVGNQKVGVRAILEDYRPVVGPHPARPTQYIFSGLGSHGAIQAPVFARHLADHFRDGVSIRPDVAVSRFL